MPNTILHFGINSDVAFVWSKYFDIPSIILINVFINFEAYVTIILRSTYPQHGYAHTFLIGTLVAVFAAFLLYASRNALGKLMKFLRLPYETSFRKILVSCVFGAWLHIFMDAFIYADSRPFFPFQANPLYGHITEFTMNLICVILFIPAIILYIKKAAYNR
jgi:hypothetical protein